ncbi:MAG: Kelch repeat-containing protein [Planctomycetota bacterium]|jgi:hypothetical protein
MCKQRAGRWFGILGAIVLTVATAGAARAQTDDVDVDILGGAFDELTGLRLEGEPGGKYLLLLSVVNVPNLNFIPNIFVDVGVELLPVTINLPGFVGVFDGQGLATSALFVPTIPELEIFPLYLQLTMTGEGTNKLEQKSFVQKWTLQAKDSYKAPHVGSDYIVTRSTHTMTLMPDETVLTLGGGSGGITTSYGVATAELYDLKDETLTVLGNTMVQARTGHSATLLDDSRVLIVGGADDVLGEPTATAEVYDPVTGVFSAVGSLTQGPRALHRATLLQDGRVLITGGTDNYIDPLNIILGGRDTTELFDPVTNTFSAGPDLSRQRLGETATLLPDGTVLIAGGFTTILGFIPSITPTAEIYTPSPGGPGSVVNTDSMLTERFGHAAVLMTDGSVLVVGGANGSDALDPQPELTWELWDPFFHFFVDGALSDGRILPTANLLRDGRVLIAGGATGGFTTPISVASTEIFDINLLATTAAASMLDDRAGHQGISMEDGTVLLSGGGQGDGLSQWGLSSLEIYQP